MGVEVRSVQDDTAGRSSSAYESPPSRILVRATNWIGDTVMSLAALREVRRLNPRSHLAVIAREWVAEIYREQNLVDSIIPLQNGRSSLWRRAELRDFDVAILFQNAFEAALLIRLAGISERIGYRTQWRGPMLTRSAQPRIKQLHRHQIYHYLDLLYQTGLSDIDYLNTPDFKPDISLKPPAGGTQAARELLDQLGADRDRPLVGINPGAFYGGAKRWLSDRYAELADRLIERGFEVAIFGSAGERVLASQIEAAMHNTPRLLSGRTDLTTLLGAIAACRLFITNDSGPMHLAAALGTPLIALFGSTDEVATGPYSDSARLIHKHVECSPCLKRECPIDLRCFKRIEVDEVYEMSISMLGEQT